MSVEDPVDAEYHANFRRERERERDSNHNKTMHLANRSIDCIVQSNDISTVTEVESGFRLGNTQQFMALRKKYISKFSEVESGFRLGNRLGEQTRLLLLCVFHLEIGTPCHHPQWIDHAFN